MEALARSDTDWKAPAQDGRLLVWPEPDQLLRDTRRNHERLAREDARVQNVPLHLVRSRLRQFVAQPEEAPLLASGHQTELYHSGVWAKDALINAASARIGGTACHIAVDTDAPKHLNLRWPGGAVPLTDDPRITTAAWSGVLAPPTVAHLQAIATQFEEAAANWDFEPLLPRVLQSLRGPAPEGVTLSSALTAAQHALDWELGLRHRAILASPLWDAEPFALFAHHILARADRFAADYNAALRDYRRAHGVKSRTRPMPDLFRSDESIEMPFWLDDMAAGTRVRPSVFGTEGGKFVLQLLNGEQFAFDPAADGWEAAGRLSRFLNSTAHRLAPRALTLTMFVRLCLVDQFVHGIGGGRYDRVTDRLIASHFGVEPPPFSVTTATLYFPAAVERQRVCVPCVRHEGHRLRHGLLGERKREYVERMEALPRRSPQREAVFLELHNALDAAARGSDAVGRWRQRLLEAQLREREEAELFDRELFYALQPRHRLEQMIQQYGAAFG